MELTILQQYFWAVKTLLESDKIQNYPFVLEKIIDEFRQISIKELLTETGLNNLADVYAMIKENFKDNTATAELEVCTFFLNNKTDLNNIEDLKLGINAAFNILNVIDEIKAIKSCDGVLVGTASWDAKKFLEIINKGYK